jgi:hypothetical protein
MTAAVVTAVLAGAPPGWAGVYMTPEPPKYPKFRISADGVKPFPLQIVLIELSEQTGIRLEQDRRVGALTGVVNLVTLPLTGGPLAVGAGQGLDVSAPSPAFREFAELVERQTKGALSLEDKINLSAYLIRLGQSGRARELLELVVRPPDGVPVRSPKLFMVYANLATACQMQNDLPLAESYLRTAVVDYWPRSAGEMAQVGLSKERLAWLKSAEKFQLELIKQRRAEADRRAKAPGLDSLFASDFRFVGDGGQFEAGKLVDAERNKLPPDPFAANDDPQQRVRYALGVVQQLLLWMPDDVRLKWLMGELFNAQGDVAEASNVLESCTWNQGLYADEFQEHRRILKEAAEQQKPQSAAEPETSWLPDGRRLLLVGGLAGAVVLFLAVLQIREFRRRKSVAHR